MKKVDLGGIKRPHGKKKTSLIGRLFFRWCWLEFRLAIAIQPSVATDHQGVRIINIPSNKLHCIVIRISELYW
jgi:hypothetical protein